MVTPSTAKVGDTLTVTVEDADGNEVDLTDAEIQWYADGVEISDATDAEYTVLESDAGVVLSVEVTIGTETYTAKTAAVSEGIAEDLAVSIDNTEPKVGDILTAIVTPDDAVVTYSWTAGDTVVGTEEELEVTADMLGKKIKVKVTALDSETATSAETAAVAYDIPEILTAVRKAANSFTLNFDSDAQNIVKVDDIVVISEDKTDVKKITGLDFDKTTGESAVVTVSTPFKNGVTYNVYMKDDETNGSSFVASVGDVAKIEIDTTTAEVNTNTKIKFALFDENGVDVTSAIKVDETCSVSFAGDYNDYDNTKASNTTVIMTTVGAECTVTVEYNKNDGVSDKVTKSGVIKCEAANEKHGNAYFKVSPAQPQLNDTDLCFRFYDPDNSTDTNVSVALDKTVLVHFYAQDKDTTDKSAISYDSYEIESADETIAIAELDKATGKWASFYVTGNQKGSVVLTLTATKNGTETTYDIPVTVTEQAVPVKVEIGLTKKTMSNAWDKDYSGTVSMTVLAADGSKADPKTYTVHDFKCTNKFTYLADTLEDDEIYNTDEDTGFKVYATDTGKMTAKYTAYAAKDDGYVIEGSVTDNTTGKVISNTNTVRVKELPKEAWIHTKDTYNLYGVKAVDVENNNTHDHKPDGIDDDLWMPVEDVKALPVLNEVGFTELKSKTPTSILPGTRIPTGALTADVLADDYKTYAKTATPAAATAIGKFNLYSDNDGDGTPDAQIENAGDLLDLIAPPKVKPTANVTIPDIYKVTIGEDGDEDPATKTLVAWASFFTEDGCPQYTTETKVGADAYKDLGIDVYTTKGVTASYAVEMEKSLGYKSDLELVKAGKGMTLTKLARAKLSATMGGLFAGYVHQDGSIGTGHVVADLGSRIINSKNIDREVEVQTYFGKTIVGSNVNGGIDTEISALYGVGTDNANPATAREKAPAKGNNEDTLLQQYYQTVNDGYKGERPVLFTAQKDQIQHDVDFAREGEYTVEFSFWFANSTKAENRRMIFKVKDDLYVPGVDIKSQNLESYSQDGWKDAVVSEVDLNNDDPTTYSVIDLVDKNGKTISNAKTPAKWVVVTEESVDFYKPCDRLFKLS